MNSNRLGIIDDEPGFREFVAHVARTCGFDAFATDDPNAFLEYVRSRQPAVVVLDLLMPQMDGIELLRGLVGAASPAHVLLASGADSKVLDTAFRLGRERGLDMAGMIQKPIRAAQLKEMLEKLRPAHPAVTVEMLRHAVEAKMLRLHYQPQVDVRSMRVHGAEALVRWEHPENGLIPPHDFIPLAEESDLIDDVTEWVFIAAVEQCGQWRRDGLELNVSVNLSARNIGNIDLPDWLSDLCRNNAVPPPQVTVELTETASMRDTVQMMDVLTRFRLKGFKLSIDDFGTGYSSLVQLQRLPFSEMKIDKSFVMTMHEAKDSAVIVKTIVDMARNLSLMSVAEGVENPAILDQLAALGCDSAQGYGIAKPMPAETLPSFVRDWHAKQERQPANARNSVA